MLLLLLLEGRNWGLLMQQLLFLIEHMLLQLLMVLVLVRIPMRCGLQRRELALRARGGHSSVASAGKRLAAGGRRRPGRGAAKLLDICPFHIVLRHSRHDVLHSAAAIGRPHADAFVGARKGGQALACAP